MNKNAPRSWRAGVETHPRNNRPARLDTVLSSSFKHLGIESKIREHRIRKLWIDSVGENIAKRARPVKLLGTVLYCTVSSSVWMSELNYQKSYIIEKINKLGGSVVITDIVLRPGRIPPSKTEPAAAAPPARRITQEEKRFIEDATASLKDGYLKDLIRRAFAKGRG